MGKAMLFELTNTNKGKVRVMNHLFSMCLSPFDRVIVIAAFANDPLFLVIKVRLFMRYA